MASIDCAIALVDKPAGITSHDVVYRVRGRLSAAESERAGRRVRVKVGHAGTLDPFATGLLVVLVGRATRLQRYLLDLPKTYVAVARLGERSTTGDPEGEITRTGRLPSDPRIPEGVLKLPVPAYSAVKVEGERLYRKARRGEDFQPPVREMTVYRARRMEFDGESATFRIDCAGGTYVRSVVATLEDAYCERLRRTRVGELSVDDAVGLDELSTDDLIGADAVLAHLPGRELTVDQAWTLIHGRVLEAGPAGPPDDERAVRLTCAGRLIGVGRWSEGALRPETILTTTATEPDGR